MYQRCEFHLQLNSVEVTAYCRWDELKKQLTPSERPVVLNRASSTNTTNPFGSTFCYGYQDIIFEVGSIQNGWQFFHVLWIIKQSHSFIFCIYICITEILSWFH